MKKLVIPIMMMMALLLAGCAEQNHNAASGKNETASPVAAQTASVQLSGFEAGDTGKAAVYSNGWIYYSATDEEGYSLYKMAEDGSQSQKVIPAYIGGMAVGRDTLYYIGSYDPNGGDEEHCKLYKVDLKTGKKTLLMKELHDTPCLAGNYLYISGYIPYDTEGDIYRLDLNVTGSVQPGNIEELLKTPALQSMNAQGADSVQTPLYYDGWLYYVAQNEELKDSAIRRMRYDGAENEQFYKRDGLNHMVLLGFYEGRLFFTEGEKNTLYSLDNKGALMSYPGIESPAGFDGQWVYFTDNDAGVYRCSLKGGEKALIAKDRGFTDIAGGWLFTWDIAENGQLFKYLMSKDGGTETALTGHYIEPAEPSAEPSAEPEYKKKTVGKGNVTLIIKNEGTMACYKLIACNTSKVVQTVLVEPYTELTLKFGDGFYNVRAAYGDEWLGEDKAFGKNGKYIISEMYSFHPGGVYELSTSSVRGDFSTDSMSGFTGK